MNRGTEELMEQEQAMLEAQLIKEYEAELRKLEKDNPWFNKVLMWFKKYQNKET